MMKDGVESYRKVDDGMEENAPAVVAYTETDVNERSEEVGENELLPGIPNDITVQVIGPKLSFKEIAILCLVNKKWGQTVQSGQVHDARVRSNSTETLIILHQNDYIYWSNNYTIALHSPRDLQPCFFLPPIPVHGGYRRNGKCIALASKIYFLGGEREGVPDYTYPYARIASNEVYAFDLVGAGLSQWKQCASMQAERSNFAAGALDGKIYVFGTGLWEGRRCEVYDPEIDTWSPIPDMIAPWYFEYQVATLEGELFLYGGTSDRYTHTGDLVAYHPGKNEWRRIVDSCDRSDWESAFVAQGKFHRIGHDGIDVYDMEKNSWSFRYSIRGFTPDWMYAVQEVMGWEGELMRYIVAAGDTIWVLTHGHAGDYAKIKGLGSNQSEVDYYVQTAYPGDDCLTIQL